jgi:FkbM family methyltransferase
MGSTYHTFDNGLRIHDSHIIDVQRERYQECNVHEVEEESLFLEQLKAVKRAGVYVNIGAAVGYYSILTKMIRHDVTVHAYEPLSMHRKYMSQNIALNGLKKNAIKIFIEAISTKADLSRIKHNDFSSALLTENKKYHFVEKLKGFISNKLVKTVPLDVVVSRAGGCVDLLQMDIQGHELMVFQAARETLSKHGIKRLIVGTHSDFIHRECAKILTEAGYKLSFDCYETKSQPDGILIGGV